MAFLYRSQPGFDTSIQTIKGVVLSVRKYTLTPNKAFSAGQIADAVGAAPRVVRRALSGTTARQTVVREGNVCKGFGFDQLPENYREKITGQQLSLNYRSPEHVLSDPKKQWNPVVPLSAQSSESIEYAHSLQKALARYLARRNDLSLRSGELIELARKDWEAAFRKPVQRRHIERMITRVLERDNGREEFSRLEIYLPDTQAARSAACEAVAAREEGFLALEDALSVVPDIAALAISDRGTIWRAVMEDFDCLIGAGEKDKKAKRRLLDFLITRVPRLAETRNALRVQFDSKRSAYLAEGVTAIRDKRRENSGRRTRQAYTGPESLTADETLLLGRANSVGGGLSQAFRELHTGIEISPGRKLQFSEEFRAAYSFDPRSDKSYVPQSLRDKLRPLLESIKPLTQGPKAARLASPSIRRDWSNVPAGASFQSDDETGNHYIWVADPEGEYEFDGMRFDVLRPQILPMVDVRTDYILSVLLLCRRNYNSHAIRSLILKTCLDERIGLPFESFYFEGNIWQARNIQAMVSWTQIDDAFARAGVSLRLRHATTPRAKIIERIFSQEQNAMQALPGYAGRDERNDCPESTKAALASLKKVGQPKKQEVDPSKHFLSAERYLDLLQANYERFNHEPQNGERLEGMSPAEAWKQLSGGRPHQVLPDSLRYLLATEQSELKVTRDGIGLRIGGRKRYFFESAKLGSLVGEQVVARWNQDFPDHVVVVHPKSDPHGARPFVVAADPSLDAMNATEADFEAARRRRKEFTNPQRALFRMLKHEYGKTVRNDLLGGEVLRRSGEAHNEAESGHVEKVAVRKSSETQARQTARRVGLESIRIANPERAVRELEGIEDLEARILAQESSDE